MSDLIQQLERLAYNRERHQSVETRKDRADMLALFGRQLLELGFADLMLEGLAPAHINGLLALWHSQGLCVATLRNRVAVLRWWARIIHKEDVVFTNAAYGLGERKPSSPRLSVQRKRPSGSPRKMCRVCLKVKRLDAFTKSATAADGHSSQCLVCGRLHSALYDFTHRKQKHAYDAAHKAERRARDKKRRARRGCLYVVQLLGRSNTVKIGYTTNLQKRLRSLRLSYGEISCLLALPQKDPRIAERIAHKMFARMRLYEEASWSELFYFNTRTKQKQLEAFCAQFSTYCVDAVVWTAQNDDYQDQAVDPQQYLFS